MDRPVFILSFDAESKWGILDRLTEFESEVLSNNELLGCYRSLIKLLYQCTVKSTFACTFSFLLSQEDFMSYYLRYSPKTDSLDMWLENYFAVNTGPATRSGWHMPELRQMLSDSSHEIGGHGFTHYPVEPDHNSRMVFESELAAMRKISRDYALPFVSYVYPRNAVFHTDLLSTYGITNYRSTPRGGFVRELNFLENSDKHAVCQGVSPVNIPAGHFFNWRFSFRKVIPPSLTITRAKHIIDDAIRKNQVAHFWLHPHNLLTGPGGFDVLYDVLDYVNFRVKEGDLDVYTLGEYASLVGNDHGS